MTRGNFLIYHIKERLASAEYLRWRDVVDINWSRSGRIN